MYKLKSTRYPELFRLEIADQDSDAAAGGACAGQLDVLSAMGHHLVLLDHRTLGCSESWFCCTLEP